MDKGWVKLHRKILDSDMWKQLNAKQRDVLITVLLMVNYSENDWEWGGSIYRCQPGEAVTSVSSILERCAKDQTAKSVRCAIKKIEKWGFWTYKGSKINSKITILNWATYQDGPTREGHSLRHSEGTAGATNKKDKKEKELQLRINNAQSPAERLALEDELGRLQSNKT